MPTETLYCNAFDGTTTAWVEVGSSPYLQDNDVDHIKDYHAGYDERYFRFVNSSGSGTINLVKIVLEAMTDAGSAIEELVTVYINDNNVGDISCPINVMTFLDIDITAILDTWAKIDAATLWLETKIGGYMRYVRRAYLLVDYGGAAAPSLYQRLIAGVVI